MYMFAAVASSVAILARLYHDMDHITRRDDSQASTSHMV